jgi:hypothetical protein
LTLGFDFCVDRVASITERVVPCHAYAYLVSRIGSYCPRLDDDLRLRMTRLGGMIPVIAHAADAGKKISSPGNKNC